MLPLYISCGREKLRPTKKSNLNVALRGRLVFWSTGRIKPVHLVCVLKGLFLSSANLVKKAGVRNKSMIALQIPDTNTQG
jgi:hypothetical protein